MPMLSSMVSHFDFGEVLLRMKVLVLLMVKTFLIPRLTMRSLPCCYRFTFRPRLVNFLTHAWFFSLFIVAQRHTIVFVSYFGMSDERSSLIELARHDWVFGYTQGFFGP